MVLLNASSPLDMSDHFRNNRLQELQKKFYPKQKNEKTTEQDRPVDVKTNFQELFNPSKKDTEKIEALHILYRNMTDEWLPFKPQGTVSKDARSMAQLVRMAGDVQIEKIKNPNLTLSEVYRNVGVAERLKLMGTIDLGHFELEEKHSNTQII